MQPNKCKFFFVCIEKQEGRRICASGAAEVWDSVVGPMEAASEESGQ